MAIESAVMQYEERCLPEYDRFQANSSSAVGGIIGAEVRAAWLVRRHDGRNAPFW
jgi:hypothetical protein